MLRSVETCFRCFLATESVNGTWTPFLRKENNGEFFDPGRLENMCCKAVTRQRGDLAKYGIVMVVKDFLSCKVFDHLIIMVQNLGENSKSPRVKCLVGSNCLIA